MKGLILLAVGIVVGGVGVGGWCFWQVHKMFRDGF
jgi:hypothetical protein